MKKLYACFCLIIFSCPVITATDDLILFEYFKLKCDGEEFVEDAPAFDDLISVGSWTKASTAKGTSDGPVMIDMNGNRMSYIDYIGSGEGNAMQISYEEQASGKTSGIKRGSAMCFSATSLPNSSPVYTAFLADMSGHPNTTTGQEIFSYHKSGATDRGRIFFRYDGTSSTDVVFGIKYNDEDISDWSSPVSSLQPVLLVVKYTKSLFGDKFELFVNPDPARPEDEQAERKTVEGSRQDLRYISFFMENKRIMKIGAIRIATSFAAAISPTGLGIVYTNESPLMLWVSNNTIHFAEPFTGFISIHTTGGVTLQESRLDGEKSVRCYLGSGVYLVRTITRQGEAHSYKVYFDN